MPHIFRRSDPFQVLDAVVCLDAVLMINLGLVLRVGNPGSCNDPVH